MNNEIRSKLRSLELQNEDKAQNLSIAYQRIAELEQQVADLTGIDSSYTSTASQIDFIKKVAQSRTKFSKEAQDIVDAVENAAAVEESVTQQPSDNVESSS